MSKFIKSSLYILTSMLLFSSCARKEFDDYYARPDGLAEPIYEQLQKAGNFKNLLACIDKSGYKSVLAEGGYWTLFAPDDAAFAKYFTEKGITSVAQIDTVTAKGIVTYGLVYSAYRKENLTSFQTSTGSLPNLAFRRRTAFYDFAYTDPNKTGKVIDNNRNGDTYVANDNNNKYLPYFIESYLTTGGLTSADYNAFYPGTTYSGFNVAGANVVKADIPAENGIIHELDKVITPLKSIDQYVTGNANYSEFKKLLNKLASYVYNADLTHRYFVLTGKTDSVFLKQYRTTLAFAPNNEAFTNTFATDAQSSSWTIAVPTDQQLSLYVKKILVNYKTFEAAPPAILSDLVNSFMFKSTVWPANLINTSNSQLELPTFTNANIVDKQMLSNGIFYGVNKVQEANVFRTVYGNAYLDPKYTLMTRAIDGSDLKVAITAPSTRFTAFMASNTELVKLGYDFSAERNAWSYLAPVIPAVAIDYGATPLARVNRLVQTSFVFTPQGEFDNITTGEGVAEGYGGEYVKFKGGKLYASGNIVKGNAVTVDSSKTAFNGKVYYTTGLLEFAENSETLGRSLDRLANSTDPLVKNKFNSFYQFLIKSSLWTATTFDITGVATGTFYTLLVPTDAAISDAVKAGLLPATGAAALGVPNYSPTNAGDIAKVNNFLQYHIINKSTVAADGKKSGVFATLLKDNVGDARVVTAFYPGSDPLTYVPSQLEFRDRFYNGTSTPPVLGATINLPYSNNLANRALIHSINKVLDYR